MDILTIVADSCRHDTYQMASAAALKRHFDVIPASSQATYTYPAHQAIFAGFYPSANNVSRPLYNRFNMSLFRWFYMYMRPHLIELEQNSSIPAALSKAFWDTVCVGGVGWFKSKPTLLADGFKVFEYERRLPEAIEIVTNVRSNAPKYALLNTCVTHRPYAIPPHQLHCPMSGCNYGSSYDQRLHHRQVLSLDYLSECLEPLFDDLLSKDRSTLVCFCGDHGECFGEDGCYGHGFYHPSVMEVPLGWSYFTGGVSYPVNHDTLPLLQTLVHG